MYCHKCGHQLDDQDKFCSRCGAVVGIINGNKKQGMKWYKFIIYVQLILVFFGNLANAFMIFSGAAYYQGAVNITSEVYRNYPLLRYLDWTAGAAFIAVAVISVYIRQLLVDYRKKAIRYYLLFLRGLIAFSIIYDGLIMLISGENAFTWLVIGGLIEMIALIIINSDYFRKRQHLFNN